MARQILGRVSVLFKGEYDPTTNYEKLDIVSYDGSSYACLKESIGVLPTDNTYWQLITKKGEKGDTPDLSVYYSKEDIDKKGFLGIGALEFKEPNEIFPFYNYWIYSGECGSFNDIYFNNEPIEIIWDGTSYILEPDKEQYSSDWGNLEDYPCYFSLSMERIITNDTSKYHKVIVKDIRGNVLIGKQLSSDYIDLPTIPTKTSELTNDSGFLTEHQDLSNYADKDYVNNLVGNINEELATLTTVSEVA